MTKWLRHTPRIAIIRTPGICHFQKNPEMEVLSLLGNRVWQKLPDTMGGMVREDSPRITASPEPPFATWREGKSCPYHRRLIAIFSATGKGAESSLVSCFH